MAIPLQVYNKIHIQSIISLYMYMCVCVCVCVHACMSGEKNIYVCMKKIEKVSDPKVMDLL